MRRHSQEVDVATVWFAPYRLAFIRTLLWPSKGQRMMVSALGAAIWTTNSLARGFRQGLRFEFWAAVARRDLGKRNKSIYTSLLDILLFTSLLVRTPRYAQFKKDCPLCVLFIRPHVSASWHSRGKTYRRFHGSSTNGASRPPVFLPRPPWPFFWTPFLRKNQYVRHIGEVRNEVQKGKNVVGLAHEQPTQKDIASLSDRKGFVGLYRIDPLRCQSQKCTPIAIDTYKDSLESLLPIKPLEKEPGDSKKDLIELSATFLLLVDLLSFHLAFPKHF